MTYQLVVAPWQDLAGNRGAAPTSFATAPRRHSSHRTDSLRLG